MTAPRKPEVELVYFAGCPHVEQARESLSEALSGTGLNATWVEWDQLDPSAPARVQGLGSPTILIGGRDVTGVGPSSVGKACRADGVPSVDVVRGALARVHPCNGTQE